MTITTVAFLNFANAPKNICAMTALQYRKKPVTRKSWPRRITVPSFSNVRICFKVVRISEQTKTTQNKKVYFQRSLNVTPFSSSHGSCWSADCNCVTSVELHRSPQKLTRKGVGFLLQKSAPDILRCDWQRYNAVARTNTYGLHDNYEIFWV